MARRGNSTQASTTPSTPTEAPAEVTTNAQEGTVSTDTSTEAPVEGTATETPAQAEAPINLDAFKAAVATAIEVKDQTTGTVPDANLSLVLKEYRTLDGQKPKNAARAFLQDSMKEGMNSMDMPLARAYLNLSENLSAGSGGGSSEKAPADPTEAFVQRAAGLRLALNLVTGNVPDGVAEDWTDKAKASVESGTEQATAYQAWVDNDSEDKGDQPETPSWVVAAVKLAHGKAAKVGSTRASGGGGSTFTGTRRDIAKHIAEAFESKASGDFLTIAEIRTSKSTEYGDDLPSAGAISARLFPQSGKCTIEGVTPVEQGGKKGATKN